MKKLLVVLILSAGARSGAQEKDSLAIRSIYDFFLTESNCYSNLEYLATRIGGRLSGSPQAAAAVEWTRKAMYEAGADTVILQPCLVPRWVRGAPEQCVMTSGKNRKKLRCIALGSSVSSPPEGLEAQVVEVRSFEELDSLGEKAIKGKIVFYNVFFDQRRVNTGQAYGEAVKYRGGGASRAARYGAVACLVRSMTTVADDEPHTGNMNYDSTISRVKIPAVALGYKSATMLHESLRKDPALKVSLTTHCRTLPPVISYNVIGQINGSRNAGEYIIAGGHLDSWDNGQGAHDDGSGVVQSIEVLAAFRKAGIRPYRSIRAVAFMNEENGLAGGKAYADSAARKNEIHIAAIESDAGGFVPRGFGVDTINGLYRATAGWRHLFEPYFIDHFVRGGWGADLLALQTAGVPGIGFLPDMQRYFDIHHSAQDTFDKINKRELELGGAAITAMVYMLDRYFPATR